MFELKARRLAPWPRLVNALAQLVAHAACHSDETTRYTTNISAPSDLNTYIGLYSGVMKSGGLERIGEEGKKLDEGPWL